MSCCDPNSWLEVGKIVGQAAAVTGGVFLGFRRNYRAQERARIREARAQWASAGETLLSALVAEASADVNVGYGAPERSTSDLMLSDRYTRSRATHEARGRFLAAGVTHALIDPAAAADRRAADISAAAVNLEATPSLGGKAKMEGKVRPIREDLRTLIHSWQAQEAGKTEATSTNFPPAIQPG